MYDTKHVLQPDHIDCLYILLCRGNSKPDEIKEEELAEKVTGFDSQNMNSVLFSGYNIDIDDYSETYSSVPMENSDMVEESIADEMKQSSVVLNEAIESHESFHQSTEEHYSEEMMEEIDDELEKPPIASLAETPGPNQTIAEMIEQDDKKEFNKSMHVGNIKVIEQNENPAGSSMIYPESEQIATEDKINDNYKD